jgi:glycosyltransferase involved in cell wall biosynthesis
MKIAFFISTNLSISHFNGILMQAKTWATALEAKGHTVIRVNPWEKQQWEDYDIIHIIGDVKNIDKMAKALKKRNDRIAFSPIIDTTHSVFFYRLRSYWGSHLLHLESSGFLIRQAAKHIKHFVVRSQYEFIYANKSYSVPSEKISIIPLSYRLPVCDGFSVKENFCLHVSKITDERKNVKRLIEAAIKYHFKLILAGSISSEKDFAPLKKLIEDNDNISYLGRVEDEELIQLYHRAKVFALPSINEGVGMVALDAALYGCEIVVTKLGGPCEYYNGMAYKVNPYSVDEIGQSVIKAMYHSSFQPKLKEYIKHEYALSVCMDKLVGVYESIIYSN